MMTSRSILIAVLMGGAILLGVCSCATVSNEPLGPGELRLLSATIPGGEVVRAGLAYDVKVIFKTDAQPTIRRACFSWSGEGPYCYFVNPKDVVFGSPGSFRIAILPSFVGSYRVECYAEYFDDRKVVRTNTVGFQIFVN